jgi:hypothetical protein
MNAVDWISVYGASLATLLGFVQVHQWRADRVKVDVEGDLSVVHTDRICVQLKARVVNTGKRSVRIRKVAAVCTPMILTPVGATPEQAKALKELQAKNSNSCEVGLFGMRGEKAVELSGDGGEHVWAVVIPPGVRFVQNKEQQEELGYGYVELTSGEKITFKFPLLGDDEWPPFKRNLSPETQHP